MLCNGLNIADNGYFTFQTIIGIAGVRSAISDAVCMGSSVIIKLFTKKLINNYTNKFGIFNYSRDHSTSIKVLKHWSSP